MAIKKEIIITVDEEKLDFTDETILDAFSSKDGKIFDNIISTIKYKKFTGIIHYNKNKFVTDNMVDYKNRLNKYLHAIFKKDSSELLSYNVARSYDYNKETEHLILFTKIYKNEESEDEW